MSIIQKTLQNNIQFIAEPTGEFRTVSIGFWFSAGSRFEKTEQSGIAHFVEHMLFKGTKTRSAYEIACAFDKIGGYVNAFTERELICLHCVVPAEYAFLALDILCDMTHNSTFLQSEIDKERSVIENEILASEEDPEDAALDAATEIVWPENGISRAICGTVKSISRLNSPELYSWYNDFVRHGPMTVCVTGDIDSEGFEQKLSSMEKHTSVPNPLEPFAGMEKPVWQNGNHFLNADFQQSQIMVLFPVKHLLSEEEFCSCAIVSALLGDTMSSRLFQALREEKGFCYTAYSFFSIYSDCAMLCFYASCAKKDAAEVVETIFYQLDLALEKGFSDEEILAAKEHLCGEEIVNAEDAESRMKKLYRNFSMGFVQSDWKSTVDQIRSVTKKVIEKTAEELIVRDKRTLVVFGPKLSYFEKKRLKTGEST